MFFLLDLSNCFLMIPFNFVFLSSVFSVSWKLDLNAWLASAKHFWQEYFIGDAVNFISHQSSTNNGWRPHYFWWWLITMRTINNWGNIFPICHFGNVSRLIALKKKKTKSNLQTLQVGDLLFQKVTERWAPKSTQAGGSSSPWLLAVQTSGWATSPRPAGSATLPQPPPFSFSAWNSIMSRLQFLPK